MPWRRLESPTKKGETVKSLLRVVVAFIAICAFGISGAVAQDTHSQGTASSAGSADTFVDQQLALLRKGYGHRSIGTPQKIRFHLA